MKEALRTLATVDGQIRPRGIADEQRVAREDEPRVGRTRAVDDRETVLGPVARDAAEDDLAEGDLLAVIQPIVRVESLAAAEASPLGQR